jgi:hypothetical protein
MPNQAAILEGSHATVKTHTFTNLKFNLNGFLCQFQIDAKIYSHFVKHDLFKESTMFESEIPEGFYLEEAYVNYRYDRRKNYSAFKESYYDNKFIAAEEGDIVVVEKLNLVAPYDPNVFGDWSHYEFTFHIVDQLIDENNRILIPAGVNPTFVSMELEDVALSFYAANIHHATTGVPDLETASKRALYIAKIAISIHGIFKIIYPYFSPTFIGPVDVLTSAQKALWESDIFINPSTEELLQYCEDIYNFLLTTYKEQKRITEIQSVTEKLSILSLSLHVEALKVLGASNKLSILEYVVRNFTLRAEWLIGTDYEGLVLKIINSVTETQSDEFLAGLIDNKKYSFGYYSLFDTLFENLDDSFLGIGDDNKNNLVTALYDVWISSSYNPYQNGEFSQTNMDKFEHNDYVATNPDPSGSIIYDIFHITDSFNYLAAPASLNYIAENNAGYYFDNFDFLNTNNHEKMSYDFERVFSDFKNREDYPPNKIIAIQDNYMNTGDKGLYGTYDFYQPVSVNPSTLNGVVKFPVINPNGNSSDEDKINSLIPIFVLKYMDDKSVGSNFETTIGYFVDVASLFAGGYALAAKVKYLRTLSGFTPTILGGSEYGTGVIVSLYVAATAETINFTAASLSLLAKILTNTDNQDEPWFKELKNTLMWVEIFSGAGSVLSERFVRTTTRKLVTDFNTNNSWPSEFVDDPRGGAAQLLLGKISNLSNEVALALNQQFKEKILARVQDIVKSNAEFSKFRVVNGVIQNTPLHTAEELEEIVLHGFSKGLSKNEIEGLVSVSYRKGKMASGVYVEKQILASELKDQMTNWATIIKPRKFPYKFNSLGEFNNFKDDIENLLEDFHIPTNDIRIQGSSLRTAVARDVDIAIFVDENQLNTIKNNIIQNFNAKYGGDMDLLDERLAKFIKNLDKGFIKAHDFGSLNGKSFIQQIYDRNIYSNIDVSIIIKDKSFDLQPYLKFID